MMNWLEQENKLQQTLSPQSIKLDDRSTTDLLSFVAKYSELILYYDQNNNPNGNWREFFLKAPQILLAAISKTNYQLVLRQFNALTTTTQQKSTQVSLLCELIQELFVTMNDWLVQMQNDQRDYLLKSYLIEQISTSLSEQLNLFIEVQKNIVGAEESLNNMLYLIQHTFAPLWRSQVQSAYQPEQHMSAELQGIFKTLFSVFVKIIDNADSAYQTLKNEINNHPDTALLISFVRLLKIHQQQLNKVSQKHLDFYYRDVLHQAEQQQVADQAYLCVTLTDKAPNCVLPKDIAFDAGVDRQGQAIIFANVQEQAVNQAKVVQLQQVNYQTAADSADNHKNLYLKQRQNVAEIKYDQHKQVQSWPLFYQIRPDDKQQVQLGFAIASPMFFLQSSRRYIEITCHYIDSVSGDLFSGAQFYLTNAEGWFEVTSKVRKTDKPRRNEQAELVQKTSIIIDLDSTDSLVAATKNADGMASPWPFLKVLFGSSADLKVVPQLKKIDIVVEVFEQQQGISLANDLGVLASDAAFLPFGPIVNNGANFYLTNCELITKPLTSLNLSVKWKNLPDGFGKYYQPYNNFLSKNNNNESLEPSPFNNNSFKVAFSFRNKQVWRDVAVALIKPSQDGKSAEDDKAQNMEFASLVTLFQPLKVEKKDNSVDESANEGLFSALLHKLNKMFGKLEKFALSLIVTRLTQIIPEAIVKKITERLEKIAEGVKDRIEPFFEEKSKTISAVINQQNNKTLVETSSFEIQTELLPVTPEKNVNQQTIRMQLRQPELGFGYSIYDKVVTDVTQQNSLILLAAAKKPKAVKATIPLPNLPFAPEIKELSFSYKAQQSINLQTTDNAQPLTLFHFNGFSQFPVYNSQHTVNIPSAMNAVDNSINDGTNKQVSIPLYSGIAFDNVVYIGCEKLVAPCQLSIYFQLCEQAPEAFAEQEESNLLKYFYLSKTGWRLLTVLSDGTHQLQCSGVIELNIPDDVCNQSVLMKGDKHWLAVGTNCSSKANVIYINTQTIKVQRVINHNNTENKVNYAAPMLVAGSINSILTPMGAIDTIEQPFSSFNGKSREDSEQFYHRVCQRLANKDRVVNSHDYRTMAFVADNHLFYCKLFSSKSTGVINLMLVPAYADKSLAGAFNPKVSKCRMLVIEQYITQRTSAFVQLKLANPVLVQVQIRAYILCPADRENAVRQKLNQALKLFISPWIKGSFEEQIQIDTGLAPAQVMAFIAKQTDVESVLFVELINQATNKPLANIAENSLIISAPKHQIEAKTHSSFTGTITADSKALTP
jgi:hypothetical protein